MLDDAFCEKLRRIMGEQAPAYDTLVQQFKAATAPLDADHATDPLYPTILATLLKEKAMKLKKGEAVEGEITTEYLSARVNSPFMRRVAETAHAPSTPSL